MLLFDNNALKSLTRNHIFQKIVLENDKFFRYHVYLEKILTGKVILSYFSNIMYIMSNFLIKPMSFAWPRFSAFSHARPLLEHRNLEKSVYVYIDAYVNIKILMK